MNDEFLMKLMTTISGIVLVIAGIYGMTEASMADYEDILFGKNAESCYAYVDYVDEYTMSEARGKSYVDVQHYDAYVHYSVDGQTFRNVEIPGTTPRTKGDVIQIYYNPNNPSEFTVRSTLYEQQPIYGKELVSIIGGIIIMLWGIFGSWTPRGRSTFDKIFFDNPHL